ncbi:alkaline phosphatase [Folsomia candida]|uniref:Alkaline phosphatase n=1 Tax=Folsomia candida TaxID=158441 RepID=A0A226ER20_FOLCA|nr:alkaline phosphatase [Folsomia candida]OXA59949.1 Membrane-bound alkaline phosphatase [Folsomia candida]
MLLKNFCQILIISCLTSQICGNIIYQDDGYMHPIHHKSFKSDANGHQPTYESDDFWKQSAQKELVKKRLIRPIEGQAKNVIFYLGDGMSVPTVTAARIFKGQQVDKLQFGEEGELHMDTFPFVGTSKTFCSDFQVADSACSATAYLTGSKANLGTIGVTPDVKLGNCSAQANPENHLSSILAWAQAQGKSTGIVTTTRITHASPAGCYAHIANRDWENDGAIIFDGEDPKLCPDIAKQLIMHDPGRNINVILGGGRSQFIPKTVVDVEFNVTGYRMDEVNLIDAWISAKKRNTASYVTTRDELLNVDTTKTDFLLGLFDPSHIAYYDLQLAQNDPSLEEMVEVAVQILSKNQNGFFLFVEGGRIDHAHHDNMVHRSLRETVEFDKAIKKGDEMTDEAETLIVVTSDHAHVMHFAGYPTRGTPILKYSEQFADDGLPYATLGYGNGPGPKWIARSTKKRHDIRLDNVDDPTYQAPVPVPNDSETHGGDDVLIFAKGPYAHLLTGVHQQSYIPHVVGYAACMGDGVKHCDS